MIFKSKIWKKLRFWAILGKNSTKFVQKGAKKSNLKISTWNFFGHFLRDQKMSSYGKNQSKQDKGMIGSPDFQNMKEIEILR